MQKYYTRGFIWMVTPQDFVNRLKSSNLLAVFIIDSGSERFLKGRSTLRMKTFGSYSLR